MTIDEEVAQQNIIAGQALWEGIFQCPMLVVNNGETTISKENSLYLAKIKAMTKKHLLQGGKDV